MQTTQDLYRGLSDINPLVIAEELAQKFIWGSERTGVGQITMQPEGRWWKYQLTLGLCGDDVLRLISSVAFKDARRKEQEFITLVNLVNDEGWDGYFVYRTCDACICYRSFLSLAGGAVATSDQIENMVLGAYGMLDRCFPAFASLVENDYSPEEALSLAFGEVRGSA